MSEETPKYKQEFYIEDEAWAKELEQGVVEYMDSLFNALYEDEDIETRSGQVFCGCDTCFWREALVFVTPILLRGHKEKKVVLVEDSE